MACYLCKMCYKPRKNSNRILGVDFEGILSPEIIQALANQVQEEAQRRYGMDSPVYNALMALEAEVWAPLLLYLIQCALYGPRSLDKTMVGDTQVTLRQLLQRHEINLGSRHIVKKLSKKFSV